jgi:uncharacterized integral membrane protein (TIGR00698 family)
MPPSTPSIASRPLGAALGVERPGEALRLLPGVLLAALVMLVSLPLSDLLGGWVLSLQGIDPSGKASPISGVLLAIVLGMLLGNFVPLPAAVGPGIRFSLAKLLRLGIIFVGIKLSLLDVLKLGAWGIPVVVVAIASGLVFVTLVNRLLGLPDRLGTLIAAGTGICGITAILSTAPAIEAEDREVTYAVANIALFGLLGMFVYPYLAPLVLDSSEQVGLFLGTAVHDTAQVVGSALTYRELHGDDLAFRAATVTKLTRNLFLLAVVPLVSLHYLRRRDREAREAGTPAGEGSALARVRLSKLFPLFVLGFLAMAIVRSLGDATLDGGGLALGLFDAEAWRSVTSQIGEVWGSRYLLGTAMAAVGLGTRFSVFRGVGFKPFLVGLAGALFVGAVGMVMALLVGPYVHL